jgi:hypothetical protein
MLAALTPAVISAVRMGFGQPAIYIIGAVTIAITLFFTGMHYTVADGRLSFRMWSIRGWSVEIADIRSVWRSYNPLSSPAASLKRLHIQFRKGVRFQYILISPARERQFLDDLKAVNPEIVVNVPEKRTAWRIWDWDI